MIPCGFKFFTIQGLTPLVQKYGWRIRMSEQPLQESESVELKKSLAELKQGLVSMAAILNKHQAGILWFGVRNNGAIVGIDANEKTLRDLSQSIAAHIEPKIYPHITLESQQDKSCIKIVFRGKDAPYFAYGKAYMRVADEDRQLSARELEQLILAKHRDTLRWDSEPSSANVNLGAIDPGKLKRFVENAGLSWSSPADALEKLGGDYPRNYPRNYPRKNHCLSESRADFDAQAACPTGWSLRRRGQISSEQAQSGRKNPACGANKGRAVGSG